jgi:hypothetical protein
MKTSIAMQEVRKIREENSIRHLKMTSDEMFKEFSESIERFNRKLGKNVKVVSKVVN